jgi:methyl-accepting chemotaxis protein
MANLRIGARLGLGFGLVTLMIVVMAYFSISRVERLERHIEHIVNDDYAQIKLLGEMRQAVMQMAVITRNMALDNGEQQLSQGAARLRETQQRYAANAAVLRRYIAGAAVSGPAATIAQFEASTRPIIEKAAQYAEEQRLDEVTSVLINEAQPAQERWLHAIDEMIARQEAATKAATEDAVTIYQQVRLLILVTAAVAALISAVTGWLLTRGITRALREAVAVARNVAAGKLDSNIVVRRGDETGELMAALRAMNRNLQDLVGDVRGGAKAMHAASAGMVDGNHTLSVRTDEQVRSLQDTALLMTHLTQAVSSNAASAARASELVVTASAFASASGAAVNDVVETMQAISASANKVVDIIGVINGIAFQTNILALNAAVEAARAGESGRGFAVVAAEVRALAQRSAEAARQIKDLIDDSVNKVGLGGTLVKQAGGTITDVITSIRQVEDIVQEVKCANQKQEADILQVNRALQDIDQRTQQNAAHAEQAESAAQALLQQAGVLDRVVGQFVMADTPALHMVDGGREPAASPASPARRALEKSAEVPLLWM